MSEDNTKLCMLFADSVVCRRVCVCVFCWGTGAEGVPGQRPARSHSGAGGRLEHGPGLDGRPQWRRETEDGCKSLLIS